MSVHGRGCGDPGQHRHDTKEDGTRDCDPEQYEVDCIRHVCGLGHGLGSPGPWRAREGLGRYFTMSNTSRARASRASRFSSMKLWRW
jgi:hypothetical protein